jgi:hypothetical protein
MTAAAQRRNTVCILDTTDTNPHIPHETTTTTTNGWPDWPDDPNNNGISLYGTIAPQRTRPTVCIPDTDNTPWSNHSGEDITNWTDDTGQISWHDSPLIRDNTIERTTPTIDTNNDYSSHTPPSDDDTFTDFNDPYTPTNGEHEIPSPPPQPTKAAAVMRHPHPPFPRQLDISTFATQNTHGLRRLPRDTDGKLITTEPYDYTRYEHLITMMKTKSLDVYLYKRPG